MNTNKVLQDEVLNQVTGGIGNLMLEDIKEELIEHNNNLLFSKGGAQTLTSVIRRRRAIRSTPTGECP